MQGRGMVQRCHNFGLLLKLEDILLLVEIIFQASPACAGQFNVTLAKQVSQCRHVDFDDRKIEFFTVVKILG
jgi:hypothetical protein